MQKKFTFKTVQPVGRYRSFDTPEYLIKYNKISVGYFTLTTNGLFSISLRVEKTQALADSNPNCNWLWITFKTAFKTLEGAKLALNNPESLKVIHAKYTIVKE